MSDHPHGGGGAGGGRRDRATSVLQSAPLSNRSIAPNTAAGAAAGNSSGGPPQRRHARQGSADWANLAASAAAGARKDSPTNSSSRAFVPAPAVLEDDEIEGTEVPFFASTRFDESPHQQHRASSSSNGISTGGGGESAGAGGMSSPQANSAASTSASASSVAASSTSAAVRPVSSGASGALSPAGSASASSRRTPSSMSMGSKLEPTVQEDEEGYSSELIHAVAGPPPHAHVSFMKQKSTPSVHHHMPPHPATHTWVPERRSPGIAFSPPPLPPAPASSPSPPPFHPAPARPLSVRLHSPSHSTGSSLNSPSFSTIETVPVVLGEGAGTSAPVSTTTSPATLERMTSMEQQRPRTTSHATLSARGGGPTSFADAIQATSVGATTEEQQDHPIIVVDRAAASDSAYNLSASPATPLSARAADSDSPVYSSPPSAGSSHSRHVSFPNLSAAQQSRLRGATVSLAGDRSMVASNRSPHHEQHLSKRHESTASLSILTGPSSRLSLREQRGFGGRLDSLGSDLSVDDNVGGALSSPPSPRPPLSGLRRLVRLIRTKLMPQFRGRTWSSKSIIDRFLSHTYGQFDVTSMLAQQFGLEEFKQRMAAKLHHLDGSAVVSTTAAAATLSEKGLSPPGGIGSAPSDSSQKAEKVNEIVAEMSDMFRSLKTFHKLLDGTSVLHAHLSKRQALQNIISTVFALLDAEKVTVFLLHTKPAEESSATGAGPGSAGNGNSNGSQVTLKAVTAVTNAEGETTLRPADVTVASELVSIVARTGELRNIRDCATEPLCWIGSNNSPNVTLSSGMAAALTNQIGGSSSNTGVNMPHSAGPASHQPPQTTPSPASGFDFSSSPIPATPATPSMAPPQSLSSTAPSALQLTPQAQTLHGHGAMTITTLLAPIASAYSSSGSGSTPTPGGSATPPAPPPPGHGHGHSHGSMRRNASPKYFSQTMRIFPKVCPAGESGEWGSLGAAAMVLGSPSAVPVKDSADDSSTRFHAQSASLSNLLSPFGSPLKSSPTTSDGTSDAPAAGAGFSSPVPSKATISGSPLSASALSSPPAPSTSPPPTHGQARLAALALLSPPPSAAATALNATAPSAPAAFLTPQHAALGRVDFSSTMGAMGTSSGSVTARNSDGITASPVPSRGLFDRGGSLSLPLGASPSPPAFQLRNCLCVPVRGNASGKDAGECSSAGGSASCATLGSGSKSGHRSADPGKEVVAVLQVCNKKSGPHFTSEDVQILQFISLLAGQSLTNANLYSEAVVRRRQQEALCEMIELLSAESGVDEVIECIIQAAYRLLEVDRISLYIVDEVRAQLVCKVSKDVNAIGQRLPLKWGLIGRVAQEGKSINISDAANDPRFDRTLDKVTGYQTRNILTLPIQDNKNRVAAVIQISNKKKGNFSREDETLMMSLSRSAGQILRKAQLFSALITEQRKTKALMDILRAEEGEPSIESLCDRILQTTHDVLPCQKVALCFVDAVREDLYALVAEPMGKIDPTAAAATVTPVPAGAAGSAHQPPVTPSTGSSVTNHESANTSPISAAPQQSHGHVVGTPVGGGAILFSPRSGTEEMLYSARGSPARDLSGGNASLSNSASSSSLAKPKRAGTKGGQMPALPSTTKHLSLPLHRGLAGWVAEHGQSCNLSNALADPRYDPLFDKTVSSLASATATASTSGAEGDRAKKAAAAAAAFKTRTSLCVPLHNTTGTTIAVLQAINRIKKKDDGASSGSSSSAGPDIIVAFSEEDEEIFNALCIQAGITLRRRLTEVLLGRSRRELGDDKQINSLFEIYGGNYLSSSGGGAATPSQQQQGLDSSLSGGNLSRTAQTPTAASSGGGSSMTPIGGGHVLPLSPSARMTTSDSKQTVFSNSSVGGPSPGARARRKTLSEMPVRKPFTAPLSLPKPHASSPSAGPSGSPPVAPAAPSALSLGSPPSSTPLQPPSLSSGAVGSKHARGAGSSGGVALPTIPSSPSPAALPASSSMVAQDYHSSPTPLPSPSNGPLGGAVSATEHSAVAGQGTVSRLMPVSSSTRSSRSVSPRPRLTINPPTGPIVPPASTISPDDQQGAATPTVLLDDAGSSSSSFVTDAVAADMGAVSSNLELSLTRRRLGALTGSSAGNTDSESDSQPSSPSSKQRQRQQFQLMSASRSSSSTEGPRFPWPVLVGPSLSCVEVTALHSMETFNVFDYTEDQLVHFSLLMLHDLRLVGDFGFSLPKLQSFLVAVRKHYNANPYHNYSHGFAVMHFAYWMLRQTDAIMFLSKVDQLALLIAALCHDVDHPGTTNGFQIAKQSDVARAHNDVAVLENHHAFVTFELLRDPELNVLTPDESEAGKAAAAAASAASANTAAASTGPRSMSGGSPASGSDSAVIPWTALHFRNFRKTVIGAILATDMSKHFSLCSKLDSMEPECGSLDPSKEEDRQFMIDLLTHSADLSAQVLPYEMARAWEDRLTQEFIHQSAMEETLGLPISTFMQGLADPAVRFKAHLNYLDYIASPLWMGVAELLPPLSICVRNLLDNRKRFMRFIPQEEEGSDNAAAAAAGPVGSSSGTRDNTPPDSEPASPMLDSPSRRILDRALSMGPSPQQTQPQAPASVGMPNRALSVGLLRQQRVASGSLRGDGTPPLPPRSYSFSSTGGSSGIGGGGGGGLLGPSLPPDDESDGGGSGPPPRSASVDIAAHCTHHRASSAEGLCAQCMDECADGYPTSEANTPGGGYATPVPAGSSHFHRRKLSAPVGIGFGSPPSGSHTPSSHTSSSLYMPHGSGGSGSSGGGGGASSHLQHHSHSSLSSPHSTHSRHSSQGELFLLSSSPSSAHGLLGGVGSQNLAVGLGSVSHQRSVSGSSSPGAGSGMGGGLGGLSASLDSQQRRMISSQSIRERKAARWSALTAASGVGSSSGSSLSNGAAASSSSNPIPSASGVGVMRPMSRDGSLEKPLQLSSSPSQHPPPSLPRPASLE